jgi:hypothetical protein
MDDFNLAWRTVNPIQGHLNLAWRTVNPIGEHFKAKTGGGADRRHPSL